jgi:hypothetical protein
VASSPELEQVLASGGGQGSQAPSIQDEESGGGPELAQAEIAPIARGTPEPRKEAGSTQSARGDPQATGPLPKGTGAPGFARAGCPGAAEGLRGAPPLSGQEGGELRPVEATRGARLAVRQASRPLEVGRRYEASPSPILAGEQCTLTQHGHAFLKGEGWESRLLEVGGPRGSPTKEGERRQGG